MKIRLNKVQKELNVGLSTIVEFLQKNGFEIEENPNAVVPEEGYKLLIKEFSTDKNLRIQSEKFTQERQNKEKPKRHFANNHSEILQKKEGKQTVQTEENTEVTVIEKKEIQNKKAETVNSEFKIKVVNRIDLDALNQKSVSMTSKKKKEKFSKEKQYAKSETKSASVSVVKEIKNEIRPVVPDRKSVV